MAEQRIAYPDNPIMALAWLGCLQWAAEQPAIIKRFEEETGMSLKSPASGIERMIDEATGFRNAQFDRFVDWFNANVWGLDAFAGQMESPLAERAD
jgi:hypothetical protein